MLIYSSPRKPRILGAVKQKMRTTTKTQSIQRIAELKREGNIESSFSLSSLCSPCLCGEIFYSAASYLEGEKMRISPIISLLLAAFASLLLCHIGEAAFRDDLVLYFPFDEGNGDTVEDKSGKGNNGIIQGGADWVDGVSGKALEFNGEDSFVEVPDDDSLNPAAGTVTFWVKPQEQNETEWGSCGIVDKWEQVGSTYKGYLIQAGAAPASGIIPEEDSELVSLIVGEEANMLKLRITNTPLDKWSHIALTWDGKTVAAYLNGTVVDEGDMGFVPAVGSMFIGKREHGAVDFFRGAVDEVAVFNEVLSSGEIQDVMNSVLAVNPSGKAASAWGVLKEGFAR